MIYIIWCFSECLLICGLFLWPPLSHAFKRKDSDLYYRLTRWNEISNREKNNHSISLIKWNDLYEKEEKSEKDRKKMYESVQKSHHWSDLWSTYKYGLGSDNWMKLCGWLCCIFPSVLFSRQEGEKGMPKRGNKKRKKK